MREHRTTQPAEVTTTTQQQQAKWQLLTNRIFSISVQRFRSVHTKLPVTACPGDSLYNPDKT